MDATLPSPPTKEGDPPLTAVSLFSNCGAGDYGFRRAGFEFAVMAELDPRRLNVALANHPSAVGVEGDVRRTWPLVVQRWRKRWGDARPSLLAACPPCQGMSTARSNRGRESDPDIGSRDTRNLLVTAIAQTVAVLQPDIVVVENVPAFLRRLVRDPLTLCSMSAANLLATRLTRQYAVYPVITDLSDYGVPQSRKRAFLTFINRNHPALQSLITSSATPYPPPSHAKDHGGPGPVTVCEALAPFALPPLDAATPDAATDHSIPLHFVPVWPEQQYAMVSAIPPGTGGSAWNTNACPHCGPVTAQPGDAACSTCGAPLLRPVVSRDGLHRLVRGFRRSSYRRMSPDAPAPTITTASGRVGSNRTLHPSENRVLSPFECALLQTFPADFNWEDSLAKFGVLKIRAMIGEAVPPLFTQKHGLVLASILRGGPQMSLLSFHDSRCHSARSRLPVSSNG